jgi:hypothetical protein
MKKPPDRMQITGELCARCGLTVVFADEGKACPRCGRIVHDSCETTEHCAVCGGALEKFERAAHDATRDSIVPSALRPMREDSSVAFVFIGLVLFVASVFLLIFSVHGC